MKQQGETWYTSDGKATLSKYLPPHEKLFEKLAQKIAAEAEAVDGHLSTAKKLFLDLAKEALRNSPNKDIQRRFTFYTFDREYKIEYDIQEVNIRVYRATKSNPGSRDYEMIVFDMNSFKPTTIAGQIQQHGVPTELLASEEVIRKDDELAEGYHNTLAAVEKDIEWANKEIEKYENGQKENETL